MILYLNYEWDNSCVCINTDKGKELMGQIADLQKLLEAYKTGSISER